MIGFLREPRGLVWKEPEGSWPPASPPGLVPNPVVNWVMGPREAQFRVISLVALTLPPFSQLLMQSSLQAQLALSSSHVSTRSNPSHIWTSVTLSCIYLNHLRWRFWKVRTMVEYQRFYMVHLMSGRPAPHGPCSGGLGACGQARVGLSPSAQGPPATGGELRCFSLLTLF